MFKEFYIGRWQVMFGLKKRVYEKENPPGMYDGIASLDCKMDYELLTEILHSRAKIRAYENLSGITVPDKYKKNLKY
jgi:hypothetical protein